MSSQPPPSDGSDRGSDPIPSFGAPEPGEVARFGERPRYLEDETSAQLPPDETPDEAADGPYPYGFSETRPKGRAPHARASAAPRSAGRGQAADLPVWKPGAASGSTAPASMTTRAAAPRRRRIAAVLGIAALVLVALAVLRIVGHAVYGPQERVEALLGAVRDGEASDAEEIMDPHVPSEQRLLLQDPIYVVSGHPVEDFEIESVERDGDEAEVTAQVTQDAVTTPVSFTLERSGRQAGVFPRWEFDGDSRGLYQHLTVRVPEGAQSLSVNGRQTEVPAHDGRELTFAVLPGDYSFGAGGGEETVSVLVQEAAVGPEAVEVPPAG